MIHNLAHVTTLFWHSFHHKKLKIEKIDMGTKEICIGLNELQ